MMNAIKNPASELVEAQTLWPGDRIVWDDHPAMITNIGRQVSGGKFVYLIDVVLEDETTPEEGLVKSGLSPYEGEKVPLISRTEFMALEMDSDLTVWAVPINLIALNRASHYMDEFDNLHESLKEDTFPFFEDDFEVKDWAANNMNWKDVASSSKKISDEAEPDYQSDWVKFKAERVKELNQIFIEP